MSAELRCFLMSDLEGSSEHWAGRPDSMAEAVTVLDAEVDAAIRRPQRRVVKARGEGDSHFAVFSLASDAVLAACALQSRLALPVSDLQLRARIAIHVGEVDAICGDYYGVAVNQTARLRGIAHGGQTVLSSATALLAASALADRIELRSLGHHRIRDFPKLEEVFQASSSAEARSFPPLRTGDTHGPALMAVAMVDICGSAAAVRDLSEPEVAALQREWATSMRTLGEIHGANALKLLGDGCVAAFEDPFDCLAFARDFQASTAADGLETRAGIDVGRVELTDGEIIGTAVYRAHNLQRHAQHGEIALSQLMCELAGGTPSR